MMRPKAHYRALLPDPQDSKEWKGATQEWPELENAAAKVCRLACIRLAPSC